MVRKTFDIKDDKILKHLDEQSNQTQYIISLIYKDMSKHETITKDYILQVIEEYMNGRKPAKKENSEVKNSINNVLGMLKSTK